MNPGAVEEAGKVASTFMDVMRSQPLALALSVMNVALLVLFWYVAKTASENRQREFTAMLQSQKEVNEILSKCIVPTHKGENQ